MPAACGATIPRPPTYPTHTNALKPSG